MDLFLNCEAISEEFFIEIIKAKLSISRDKFKLRLVVLSLATGKNENYMSVVYRAKINIEMVETKFRQSVNVVFKALLSPNEAFKHMNMFPRERLMYEEILPSYEKMWLDRTGEEIKFGPRSLRFEKQPFEIIVLADLKAEGFNLMNRKVGLDMAHAQLVLAKLAKFHAASAVCYQTVRFIAKLFQ